MCGEELWRQGVKPGRVCPARARGAQNDPEAADRVAERPAGARGTSCLSAAMPNGVGPGRARESQVAIRQLWSDRRRGKGAAARRGRVPPPIREREALGSRLSAAAVRGGPPPRSGPGKRSRRSVGRWTPRAASPGPGAVNLVLILSQGAVTGRLLPRRSSGRRGAPASARYRLHWLAVAPVSHRSVPFAVSGLSHSGTAAMGFVWPGERSCGSEERHAERRAWAGITRPWR